MNNKKLSVLLHYFLCGTHFNYTNIMTKAEIVNEVAKATGVEKVTVQTVVEAFMENVKSTASDAMAMRRKRLKLLYLFIFIEIVKW